MCRRIIPVRVVNNLQGEPHGTGERGLGPEANQVGARRQPVLVEEGNLRAGDADAENGEADDEPTPTGPLERVVS